jgi:hypothetical protein
VVATESGGAETYAAALVRTVEFLAGAPPGPPSAAVPLASGLGHVAGLKRRLGLIVAGGVPCGLGRRGRAGVALVGAAWLPWCVGAAAHEAGVDAPLERATALAEPSAGADRQHRPPLADGAAGSPTPEDAWRQASAGGKYRMLLARIERPSDAAWAGDFLDRGYQDPALGDDLPAALRGYWVYAAGCWHVWRDAVAERRPPRPWGPEQAAGPPDTHGAGDLSTAWASLSQDGQDEWLLLEFAEAVDARAVEVHETFNTGAVHRVGAVGPDGRETIAWEGVDPTPPGSGRGVSRIPLQVPFAVRQLKLYVGSLGVSGWNEIDAVGLVDGEGTAHWATAAHASSTYAELLTVVQRDTTPGVALPTERSRIVYSPAALARVEGRLQRLEHEIRQLRQECRDLAELRHQADELRRLLDARP